MQLAPSEPAEPAAQAAQAIDAPDNAAPVAPVQHGPGADTEHAGDELAIHAGGLRLPIHVNARGLSLGILATIASIFALQWAQKFFVPLLLGIFIAYTLNPVVRWLERWHVRRVIGATLVTVLILGAMGGTLYRLQDEFFNIIDELPTLTTKVTRILTNSSGQRSTIQQVQAAAAEIERAASNATGASSAAASRSAPRTYRRRRPPAAASG